uniref:DUF4939 domain-containing protein n=1 Tax=Amphilophus citrinellus TaxID=61819 RepID=A0A3Q0RT84_AMPCI
MEGNGTVMLGKNSAALPAPPEPTERPLPTPEVFSGELEKCGGFVTQCSLVFRQQERTFSSDSSKIGFMAVLRSHPNLSYPEFLSKFKGVFDKGTSPDHPEKFGSPGGSR